MEESNNRIKEICAHHVTSRHGNKEACANNLSSPPNRSSSFKKTIIPTNGRKSVAIPANPSYRGALSTQVSKMVTRMTRHHDQEEREPDGWPGGWSPQGRSITGGPARVSCRGTVWRRKGLPARMSRSPRGTGTTVLTYPGRAPR